MTHGWHCHKAYAEARVGKAGVERCPHSFVSCDIMPQHHMVEAGRLTAQRLWATLPLNDRVRLVCSLALRNTHFVWGSESCTGFCGAMRAVACYPLSICLAEPLDEMRTPCITTRSRARLVCRQRRAGASLVFGFGRVGSPTPTLDRATPPPSHALQLSGSCEGRCSMVALRALVSASHVFDFVHITDRYRGWGWQL